MSICIIYHSETGNTRKVADQVAAAIEADLVEVKDLEQYSKLGRYLKGAPRASRGERDPIEPSVIDVSAYDTIVVGSPVWSRHPTPAINAAIDALKGCEGKAGIAFCTSGGVPGQTLTIMRSALEKRGMEVKGAMAFTTKEVKAGNMAKNLADLVSNTSAGSSMQAPSQAPPE